MKKSKIRTKWEDFIKKYNSFFKSKIEIWNYNLEKIKEYINKYKKKPSQKNKNIEVKSLGKWLSHQKENYSKKINIMKESEIIIKWEQFIKKYASYFNDKIEIWNDNLEEVKKYIDIYKRKPTEYNDNTKILGFWLSNQKKYYDKNIYIMKEPKIRTKWEIFIKKYNNYFKNNSEIWNDNLKEVKEYINKYKKKPSTTDKDKEIKYLGRWLSIQKSNYSKKYQIMLEQEIRIKWEEFIIEYKEYFQNNS